MVDLSSILQAFAAVPAALKIYEIVSDLILKKT